MLKESERVKHTHTHTHTHIHTHIHKHTHKCQRERSRTDEGKVPEHQTFISVIINTLLRLD